ncbi:MAG: dTDP-4-dehydrorhamnose 3,5-epimerase [Cytophagales bacterium]|nr:dTDP-4-dehydrorhamnose 3,5-epimerase [Cytophagales bacterium]
MEFKQTPIEGVWEIFPRIFEDSRGFFFESFKQEVFEKYVPNTVFTQDNQSYSSKGVLRGLHFQHAPYAQGKLVRVISGKVLDVVVDLRKDSATFGKHHKVILDGEKNNMMYVPGEFAHGFYTLEDAVFSYKCTNHYNKESESGILWDDSALDIDWGIEEGLSPIVSEKDLLLKSFEEVMTEFQ